MNSKEYNYWIDKITQDATESSEEMGNAFPKIPKEKYFNSWIETHTKALDYLIAHNREVNAYSIASISTDIVELQTWDKYHNGEPLSPRLIEMQKFLQIE